MVKDALLVKAGGQIGAKDQESKCIIKADSFNQLGFLKTFTSSREESRPGPNFIELLSTKNC